MFRVENEYYIFNENTGEHLDLKDACNLLNRFSTIINAERAARNGTIEILYQEIEKSDGELREALLHISNMKLPSHPRKERIMEDKYGREIFL